MSISMYQASVPVFIHMLNNLNHLLDKAADHAATKKFDSSILLHARLFPDMYPLVRQVQIACDTVKAGCARLAMTEIPKYEDNETSLEALKARVIKTIDFLQTLKAGQIDDSEERAIHFKIKDHSFDFTGLNYLNHFVIPNLYFHLTTTYNILRHNGVEIGKADFLGGK